MKLLAPNGKPSNLTSEQYRLVRSKNFIDWFGDWENDPENASKVVDENGEPLVMYHGSDDKWYVFDTMPKERKSGKRKDTEYGFYATSSIDEAKQYGKNVTKVFILINKPKQYEDIQFKNLDRKKYDGAYNKYKRKIGNEYKMQIEHILALEPNQIKLADGTNTTFDANNPDIRYAKGGIIAPNGKKSNLTPEQYRLVRTPEFKKWFGDWENDAENASKVVDENGEPLVCYHRTDKKFNIFDKEKLGQKSGWETAYFGFYFSNKNNRGSYGKKIMKCFLSIKNPYFIETETYSDFDYEYKRFDTSNFKNNDGIYIQVRRLVFDEKADKHFVTFEPNQIKLADGTNTTFDANNPDIRFDEGGGVDYIANDYLKKKHNHKKENATFEDLPEIYVRVGKPRMRGGKYFPSKNYVSNTKELGISVFTARYSPNSGFVFIDLNDAKGYEEESGYNIDSTYENFESKNIEIYLVEGEVIKGKPSFVQLYSGEIKDITEPYSRGGDGDRLLSIENFKIIGKLNPDKIVANIEYYKEYKYQDNPNTFSGKILKKYPKYDNGGEITLTSEQVENKLSRKLHWWNDDVVSINGIEYKKVFLRNEYKRL